jgi:hypothetical protein
VPLAVVSRESRPFGGGRNGSVKPDGLPCRNHVTDDTKSACCTAAATRKIFALACERRPLSARP